MHQTAVMKQTRSKPKLLKLSYTDFGAGVHLTAYADTIVFDDDGNKKVLAAVRFGGYAEQVRGMADAIYGGGSVRVHQDGEPALLQSLTKQYRRILTNDGVYTEATLLVEDDKMKAAESKSETGNDNTNNEQQKKNSDAAPRTSYIFCEQDSIERLFEEIDKKVSVPLIPEFSDYVVEELQKRNILKKLTVISIREKFDAWRLQLTNDEKNVTEVIEEGLRSGKIAIPGSTSENPFDEINSVSNYLNAFGIMIAEKIKGQFNPLFDPSTEKLSNEVLTINRNIRKNTGYNLYDAQLATAESIKRQLDRSKHGLAVAECGSGKIKIGGTALCAHYLGKGLRKTFNVVLCPSHLSQKWVREIEESLPNTFAIHIKSITELQKVYKAYEKDTKSCYIVITKEKARDGYMKRPAVIWNRRRRAFLCPDCYSPVMMDITDDGVSYKVEADHYFFQKENKKNHKCEKCGSALWTVLLPDEQSEWVKIPNYGYVHREHAFPHHQKLRHAVILAHSKREKHLKFENRDKTEEDTATPENPVDTDVIKTSDESMSDDIPDDTVEIDEQDAEDMGIKFPKTYYDILAVVENPNGKFHATGAYIRFPLSTYIKRKMRGKLDGLIVDEIQDYSQDSGQGDAMNELFKAAKRVVGLTGTLINGYSQGIFYLLYRIAPNLMQLDDKPYTGTKEFNDEYGVTESVYEISDPEYNSNRRTVKKKLRERQLPGVSPIVYSRFLIESTAFLSLNDMGKQLPEYEEIPVPLSMRPEVSNEYKRIEDEFISVLKYEKTIAKKVMSAFMSLLTVYPDQPYEMKPIINPKTGETIVHPKDTSSFDVLNEKDMWLLEKVKEKTSQNERVIVYTSWIRIDTQDKLMKLFKENGINADVLTAKVAPNRREAWVEKRVKSGVQVLITNPSLVETGLDLNDFTTLVYYNIGYKLFTLRQSSRRSWRINQTAPRVEVYFLYFKDVMQHRAIRLMASKLAVAGIIEGNFSDEGLAAMSECQDLTTLLAQELTLGIKNEVEDLGAVFKKMAILKPEGEQAPEHSDAFEFVDEQPDEEPEETENPQTLQVFHSKTTVIETTEQKTQTVETNIIGENLLSAVKESVTQTKPKKKKAIYVDPNQMSLFDLLGISA